MGALLNNYRLFETDQFQKDLKQIALSGQQKVTQKLLEIVYPQLQAHPHFGPNIKKLKGFDPET
jgi:mRNA interferase RelE/StbE